MGDEEHGLAALLPDARQLRLHDLTGLRVERRKGLVHEQQSGIDREGAGEIDALAHAARELARIIVLEAFEAHELEQAHGVRPLRGAQGAADLRSDFRIGENVAPGQQIVLLEHEAAIGARPRDAPPIQMRLARGGLLQPADDAQEGGLAAARGAHDGDEFAAANLRADVLQHFERAEAFGQIGDRKFDGCVGHLNPSRGEVFVQAR